MAPAWGPWEGGRHLSLVPACRCASGTPCLLVALIVPVGWCAAFTAPHVCVPDRGSLEWRCGALTFFFLYPFLLLHDNVVLGLGNGCRHQLVSASPWMHREACPTLSSVCHSHSVVPAPPRTPLPCCTVYCCVFPRVLLYCRVAPPRAPRVAHPRSLCPAAGAERTGGGGAGVCGHVLSLCFPPCGVCCTPCVCGALSHRWRAVRPRFFVCLPATLWLWPHSLPRTAAAVGMRGVLSCSTGFTFVGAGGLPSAHVSLYLCFRAPLVS